MPHMATHGLPQDSATQAADATQLPADMDVGAIVGATVGFAAGTTIGTALGDALGVGAACLQVGGWIGSAVGNGMDTMLSQPPNSATHSVEVIHGRGLAADAGHPRVQTHLAPSFECPLTQEVMQGAVARSGSHVYEHTSTESESESLKKSLDLQITEKGFLIDRIHRLELQSSQLQAKLKQRNQMEEIHSTTPTKAHRLDLLNHQLHAERCKQLDEKHAQAMKKLHSTSTEAHGDYMLQQQAAPACHNLHAHGRAYNIRAVAAHLGDDSLWFLYEQASWVLP